MILISVTSYYLLSAFNSVLTIMLCENKDRIVNVSEIFSDGLHTRANPITISSFFNQDSKWKMYVEVDGDDVALTYIKDITFNTNRQDTDVIKITKVNLLLQQIRII